MKIDLRLTQQDWQGLRKLFRPSFRPHRLGQPLPRETGAIGIVGEVRSGNKSELLVARILWPEDGDVRYSSDAGIVFDSTYLRRAHVEMRQRGLAGIVTFHTHPLSDERVGFSWFDDEQDPKLIGNFVDIYPGTKLVSVVVGKNSQCGRAWASAADVQQLAELVVIGERLEYRPLDGKPAPPPPKPSALFDRGTELTGAGALQRLASFKIGVVGASGTGSLLCELLARSGCRHIVLIDDDVVKDVNLNRILYATADDAARHTPKVAVIKRGIEGTGLGCHIDAVHDTILDKAVLGRLVDADVVFGCVDAAYPRQLLSKFAVQYLRPYIDVGSEIGKDVIAVTARTSYVAPRRHCLVCTGVVSTRETSFETLTFDERQRRIAQGYSDDLVMSKPAVMDLNMRASSYGMLVLRHLLQPFMREPVPVTITENMITFTNRGLEEARDANPNCPICRQNAHAGFGDCGPSLGFERAQVDAIIGRAGAGDDAAA